MKKFILLFIFFAGNIFAQYNNYPYNLQNIEQYVNNSVTNYKTFDSGTMLSFAYVGKQVDADQYNNNTFRMIYSWDVSSIPLNAVVSACTLYVNGTITTNSQANPYFYYYKIKGFPDNQIQNLAQNQWTAINSAQVLDPQEQVAPIGGTFSGALTFASGSSFVTYVQNSLSQRKVHLAIVALDEVWGNGVTINVSDFKINPNISTSSALKLKIDYAVPSSNATIIADNNFTDNTGNGTHGSIVVDGTSHTVPSSGYPIVKNVDQNLTLSAVSPQTDNLGYQRIWNTSSCGTSDWRRNGIVKSTSQTYLFPVTADDNNKIYMANLYQNHATTSGSLSSNESWISSVSLSGDVTVPSGVTLDITSCATVNLNGHSIKSTGGTITTNGSISGLAAKLKNGSSIKGLFPTVQGALNNAASGNTVEIQSGTFTENISVPSGVSVSGAGEGSTILNGSVTFSSVSVASLNSITVNDRINIIYSNNINLDHITAGSSNSYFDIANSTAINITNITSSMWETNAIYSHSGSDFLVMAGTLNNKADAIHLQDNSYGDIYSAYFCTNSYNDIVSFSSTANAYGCTFTSSTPGGSVYGNVYWSSWSSCSGGGGGGFLGKAPGTGEAASVSTSTDAASEFNALMKIYRNINDKVKEDKDTDKHSVIKKHDLEYKDLVKECEKFIKKYPDSEYAVSLLYRISGVLLTLDDTDGQSSFMQSVVGDSKLKILKPHALTALVSKQIKTGSFKDAVDSYEGLIKSYPSHSLVVEWLYGEGSVYKHLLKDTQKANDIFAEIIKNYPESPTAQSAKDEMGVTKENSLVKKAQVDEIPTEFSADNYPNPFNPSTTINYTLPESGIVTIRILDMLGRQVKTLVDGYTNAGNKKVVWDGKNSNGTQVTSGVYLYRVAFKGQVISKKMIMMK